MSHAGWRLKKAFYLSLSATKKHTHTHAENIHIHWYKVVKLQAVAAFAKAIFKAYVSLLQIPAIHHFMNHSCEGVGVPSPQTVIRVPLRKPLNPSCFINAAQWPTVKQDCGNIRQLPIVKCV